MAKITTCTGCLHHGLPSDSEPCWECYGEHSMVRTRYEPDERVPLVRPLCVHCGSALVPRTAEVEAANVRATCRELERLIRLQPTAARKILREVWREEMGLNNDPLLEIRPGIIP